MNLEDLYRLLRSSHVQAQGMVDTISEPMMVLSQQLCIQSANRAFFETFKVGREETIGSHLWELGDGQWNIAELRHFLEDVVPKSSAVVDYEVSTKFPGIGFRSMLVSARRLYHPDNNSITLLVWMEDATSRLQHERERELVVGELQHRMNNLLALVQSLARQTRTDGRSGAEYREDFLGRFGALVKAHELAFSERRTIELQDLIKLTLMPYLTNQQAVKIGPGPPITIIPTHVAPLNMIFHELATNAVKHGALSEGGRVNVRWEQASDEVELVWEEQSGPQVKPPNSEGFGTRLVEFAVKNQLGGRAELKFPPEGFSARMYLPLG